MLNTLRKVEDHDNHVDLSHSCSLHGGKSEVCENIHMFATDNLFFIVHVEGFVLQL